MDFYKDFVDKVLGKAIDTDNFPVNQKYQCVDLAKYFNMLFNPELNIICTESGYAKDWANLKATNGLLTKFTETAVNNMITGTLVVFGNAKATPYSHIGFFLSDNGDGTFKILHQNAWGKHYVSIDNFTYDGIIGAFIPNQLLVKKEEPKKDNNIKYINIDKNITERNIYNKEFKRLNTRLKPSKFGGLTYKVLDVKNNYALIKTSDFGEVYVKITDMTPITDKPLYEHGNY